MYMIRCCGIKGLNILPHPVDSTGFRVDPTRSRGFDRMCRRCRYTYNEARRGGGLPTHVREGSLTHRFLRALEISPQAALEVIRGESDLNDEGCWIWNRLATVGGYGNFVINNATRPANVPKFQVIHHYAYWLSTGLVPVSTIHHKCANRACFNPAHLEEATARQNMGEMFARKSYVKQIRKLEQRVQALERELGERLP